MKKLLLYISVIIFAICSSAWGVDCSDSDTSKWNNCIGTYTWSDGAKYVGEYKNGKKHGQGTFYFSDGRVWDGQWKNDDWVSGKKYAKGEVVDLLILDEEKEYTCKFYPEDVDPEWNDDSDDFPFK